MRIVFFGSPGAQSFLPLQELIRAHEIVAAVLPSSRGGLRSRAGAILRRFRGRARPPTEELLASHRIPVLRARRSELPTLEPALAKLAPDLICIAAFPYLLPEVLLATARRATLNFHPSLLPRHRGPLPLFWIYHADDRKSGATIHLVDAGADTGAIVAQSPFDLPRGFSVSALAERTRHLGAELLRDSVSNLDRSLSGAQPQDNSLATAAPIVQPGTPMVDFAHWDVERVWHFLHGLHPFFIEPLAGGMTYRGVDGYGSAASDTAPGSVSDAGSHWLLHCLDGVVRLRK
jgi:methionyl-tRNA formyltransferase